MSPTIRPATLADFTTLYGRAPDRTIRAWAAELDGQPVGIAGIAYNGPRPVMFGKITPALRPYRRFIVRAAKELAEIGHEACAVACADPREPLSCKLLQRLGFEFIGNGKDGSVYQCRKN